MHRITFTVITVAVLILIGCAQFPTSYARIEPEKARLLDFIFEPAEAAPGDTVLLKAVFAGREIAADELTWRMSQKIVVNEYGTSTMLDTVPLEITPEACTFSDRTSCIAFRFVVPHNIIAESPMAPENLIDAIPEYYRPYLPQELLSLSKTNLLALVDQLSSITDLSALPIDDNALALLPALLQCYTVPMYIHCTIAGGHKILSAYNVRYNSRFTALPELNIPVNRNPRIDSVGIYTVHAAPLASFDPLAGNHRFEYLPIADTGSTMLTIDKGCTYFMTVVTGNVDSTLSIDAAMGNGARLPEQHSTMWYVEFDKTEQDAASPYDLPAIEGDNFTAGQHLASLYPSRNATITNCTVWIEVSDLFLNEYFRPQGSMLKEIRLQFAYTEEYRKSLKKK